MIVSGSHVPGIDPATFGLPAGTAVRIERPDPALAGLIPSYVVYDSDPEQWRGVTSWALPGWSQIWVVLTAGPIGVKIRNRHYARLGSAVLYGSTSRAMPTTTNGGVTIGINISPVGWARWFGVAADAYRERITPLEQLWPADWIEALISGLHASDRGVGVKAVLDHFLLARLPRPKATEPRIARAMAALADPAFSESRDVAAALGISPQTLLRLTRAHFGHGPKLVMRRTRFLRALTAAMVAEAPHFSAAPIGYHDVPHYLRDARYFLGMTPRRFLTMPIAYQQALLRARTAVIGAPVALLDPVILP